MKPGTLLKTGNTLLLLFIFYVLPAQNFHVLDINTFKNSYPSNYHYNHDWYVPLNPDSYAILNGIMYFTATDGTHGMELWKSDGTAAGTRMVKDINPGSNGSNVQRIMLSGNIIYFEAESIQGNTELWKTNGTSNGTVMVKEIYPGNEGADLFNLTDVNGTLFFIAKTPLEGYSLWKSKGTEATTVMVKTFYSYYNYDYFTAVELTNVNGQLFFRHNEQLWKSDGTTAGTVSIMDLGYAYSVPYTENVGGFFLTAVNNQLFFVSGDNNFLGTGRIWKTDGNTITPVTDYKGYEPYNLVNVNGTIFFSGWDATNGRELWKTDGTQQGTTLVKDINTGAAYSTPGRMVNANGQLFFTASSPTGSQQLWKSDGTATGTVWLSNTAPAFDYSPHDFLAVGNKFFYCAATSATGLELWCSDGTVQGTKMVKDIFPGIYNANPSSITNFNGVAYFSANGGSAGIELWKSDGTTSGTVSVKNINTTSSADSYPSDFTMTDDGKVFFSASTEKYGRELRKTDGTASGTILVKDIYPGLSGRVFNETKLGNNVIFAAADSAHGSELWKSNGTSAGTQLVKDITPGVDGTRFSYYFYSLNGAVIFFTPDNNGINQTLWRTDGTANGTLAISYLPGSMVDAEIVNNALYVATSTSLYKTDGTTAGTVLVKSIAARNLYGFNGNLYMSYNDGVHGLEVWKTDGTDAGTVLLRDINTGTADGIPTTYDDLFCSSGNRLYFPGITATKGKELWRTDGVTTAIMRDINAGTAGCNPQYLADVNGTLYFSADDGVHGTELWKSNGTSKGTLMVKDITTGTSGTPGINKLFAAGGKLFFAVKADSAFRNDLWVSDGTDAGTGAISTDLLDSLSYVDNFYLFNNMLYITGSSGKYGSECWVGDPATISPLRKVNDQVTEYSSVSKNPVTETASLLSNPVHDKLKLIVSSKEVQTANISITTASATVLVNTHYTLHTGSNNFEYDTNAWAAGTYFITINFSNKNVISLKAIKQ